MSGFPALRCWIENLQHVRIPCLCVGRAVYGGTFVPWIVLSYDLGKGSQ